jgi:hypothetical protein
VRTLFGLTTVDTQCGLKAFKHAAAQQIFAGQVMNGLAADVEVIVRAYRLDFNPTNVHLDWRDAGDSTISVWRAGPVMFLSVIWLKAALWVRGVR